jgi:hypothetical protein
MASEVDYLKSRIWMSARKLEGGEALVRRAVIALNERDGTNQTLFPSSGYGSTRFLSEAQLRELAQDFRHRAGDPPLRRPRRGGRNLVAIATPAERTYVAEVARLLEWTPDGLTKFIERQTRRRELRTHADVTRVLTPLEAILKKKGWTCTRSPVDGAKHWSPAQEKT